MQQKSEMQISSIPGDRALLIVIRKCPLTDPGCQTPPVAPDFPTLWPMPHAQHSKRAAKRGKLHRAALRSTAKTLLSLSIRHRCETPIDSPNRGPECYKTVATMRIARLSETESLARSSLYREKATFNPLSAFRREGPTFPCDLSRAKWPPMHHCAKESQSVIR